MSAATNIEWCDSTFNPWIGCTKISPACDHCYAEALMDKRMHKAQWGAGNPRVRTSESNWKEPLKWNRKKFVQCNECSWRGELQDFFVPNGDVLHGLVMGNAGCPACHCKTHKPARRRVFCASLADVFDNEVDPKWRLDLFDLIEVTPNLDWLLLTKRIGNAEEMIRARWNHRLPDNVWLGATICNQREAVRDIPHLLFTSARIRFLSIEPMLGRIDLGLITSAFDIDGAQDDRIWLKTLDWVIVGGESGTNARPMHPQWVRDIRDQCIAAKVPFLFKQWGEWLPCESPADESGEWLRDPKLLDKKNHFSEMVEPDHHWFEHVGKANSGRRLDGADWNQFPESTV